MDKKNIVREFDAKSEDYETNRLGNWYIAQLRRLMPHIESGTGDVLDIGCGTGWLLRKLASKWPQRRFVGVDISPGMIAEAVGSLPANLENVDYICRDWEEIDLEELLAYRFSTVVCTSAFHYFADARASLEKIYNVLDADGQFCLIERDTSASPVTSLWDLLHRHLIRDHVKFYSRTKLQTMLSDAGFSNVEVAEAIARYFLAWEIADKCCHLAGAEGCGLRL